eukprot:m.165383 g.165383  ORF g.165383 m.165383 type:complete len:579 (-) comp17156_c0_seq2:2318-4054(-)
MDFDDILKFKPSLDLRDKEASVAAARAESSGKRKRQQPVEDDEEDDGDNGAGAAEPEFPPGLEGQKARAMAKLAEDDDDDNDGAGELDVDSLRTLVLSFDRRVRKNNELRVKFADEPAKFLDSEIELHESIQELHVVATTPHLYGELVRLKAVETLNSLMIHENSDISAAVVGLLQEMTDTETLVDSAESVEVLLNALWELDFFNVLLSTVRRFNEAEKEESEAVHNALGIIENSIELQPTVGERLVKDTDWMPWLLSRMTAKAFDDNKLYASEVLAILLQDSEENRAVFGAMDGIEPLLQCLARYKKRDPESSEEAEYMENIVGCLCSVLLCKENHARFLAAEGLELMILLLREQRRARLCALKVLNHALSGVESSPAGAVFVDRLGLKSLFPLFMKTPKSALKVAGYTEKEFDEWVVTIIGNLLRHLASDDARNRVLAKFVEANMEKVDRLAQLHNEFTQRLQQCEQRLAKERAALEKSGEEFDADEVENDQYLERLEEGLSVLQMVDYIAAEAMFGCGEAVRERFGKALRLKQNQLSGVQAVLLEWAANIDETEEGEAAAFKERLNLLARWLAPQ